MKCKHPLRSDTPHAPEEESDPLCLEHKPAAQPRTAVNPKGSNHRSRTLPATLAFDALSSSDSYLQYSR